MMTSEEVKTIIQRANGYSKDIREEIKSTFLNYTSNNYDICDYNYILDCEPEKAYDFFCTLDTLASDNLLYCLCDFEKNKRNAAQYYSQAEMDIIYNALITYSNNINDFLNKNSVVDPAAAALKNAGDMARKLSLNFIYNNEK